MSTQERKEPGSLRALFRHPEFAAYFLTRNATWLAYGVEDVAVAWQIFSIRHQPFDLGLVGLLLFLPQLVLALPAGYLADHVDRRTIAITVPFCEMLGLSFFIALAVLHVSSLPLNFAAVLLVGIIHAFGPPAQRSLLATIVEREDYVRASALASTSGQLITIAGPALAGLLIAVSTPLAFACAACCYGISALAASFLRARPSAASQAESLWQSATEGVRFIFTQRTILGAISLDLFAVLFGGATALLPAVATQILHVGATGFGLLRAAPALGAAIVAIFITRRPIRRRAGPVLFAVVAGFGTFTIVFGASNVFWLSFAALAIAGGFDMVSMVIRGALVQLTTPDAMRGRVGAVEGVFIGASNELGAFESGTVAALIGTRASILAGGCATLAVIALWALLFPSLRDFDALHPEEAG